MTQKGGLNHSSAVESRKILLVALVEILKDCEVLVIYGLERGVRDKCLLRRDELLRLFDAAYHAQTDCGDDRRADCADVLRACNDLDRSARAVREYLAGDVGESAAADKAENIGGLGLLWNF